VRPGLTERNENHNTLSKKPTASEMATLPGKRNNEFAIGSTDP